MTSIAIAADSAGAPLKSDEAQVLTMSAPQAAEMVLDRWLASDFEAGGSAPRIEKVKGVDARYRGERAESA